MKHEWSFLTSEENPHGNVMTLCTIVCIACQQTATFLAGTRAEDFPNDPRNRTDCRGAAWYEQNRKAARERARRLRAEGLCESCGIRPRVNETRCEECRLNHKEYEQLRKESKDI